MASWAADQKNQSAWLQHELKNIHQTGFFTHVTAAALKADVLAEDGQPPQDGQAIPEGWSARTNACSTS